MQSTQNRNVKMVMSTASNPVAAETVLQRCRGQETALLLPESVFAHRPDRDQSAITGQASEPAFQGRTGSQGILDQIEDTARQRFGKVDSECFIVCQRHGKSPRRVRDGVWNGYVRVTQYGLPDKPADGRRIDIPALNQRDKMRQHPPLR